MIERQPVVVVKANSEFPDLVGKSGQVIGLIPPESEEPVRIIVKIDGGPVINFRPGDLAKEDPNRELISL